MTSMTSFEKACLLLEMSRRKIKRTLWALHVTPSCWHMVTQKMQPTSKPANQQTSTQETKHKTARHKGFLPVSLLIHDQTAIAVRTEKNWPQLTPQSHGPSPRGVVLDNTSRERQKGLQKPPVFKSQSHIVRFVVKISVPCDLDFRSQ